MFVCYRIIKVQWSVYFWLSGTILVPAYLSQLYHFSLFPVPQPPDLSVLWTHPSSHLTPGSVSFEVAHLAWNTLPPHLCMITFLMCLIFHVSSQEISVLFSNPLFFVPFIIPFCYFKIYLVYLCISPTLKCKFFKFTLISLVCGTVYRTQLRTQCVVFIEICKTIYWLADWIQRLH